MKEESDQAPYEKPKLRIIQLATEEVLAVGCKMTGAGTAVGAGPPCLVRYCAGAGS